MKPLKEYKELDQVVTDIFDRAVDMGWECDKLAAKAGLCTDTVERLADRRTSYPRLQTVHLLAKAVGARLMLTAKLRLARVS